MAGAGIGLPSAAPERRLVKTVVGVVVLQSLGASAIVPLLPTYLKARGSSAALVGIVMASFFAASIATQYPVGRFGDRFGPRRIVGSGLVVFAVGCIGFALARGATASIAFRSLQGIGAGAVVVAGTAAVGARVRIEERGSGFAAINAGRMVAFAIGPLVGSAIGASSMRALFLAAAVVSLLALPTVRLLPPALEPDARADDHPDGAAGGRNLPVTRALVGASLVFAAAGLLGGLYESCWSLLLQLRHAPSVAIGLSWTLYCLPFACLSGPSGRLADRTDRRLLAVIGTFASALFAFVYPFLHSVVVLVGLGCLEAIGAVIVTPAALSILSGAVPARAQGAALGVVQTSWTAATALAAASCGALFGVSVPLPFEVIGGALVLIGIGAWWTWRVVPGRVHEAAGRARPAEPEASATLPPRYL